MAKRRKYFSEHEKQAIVAMAEYLEKKNVPFFRIASIFDHDYEDFAGQKLWRRRIGEWGRALKNRELRNWGAGVLREIKLSGKTLNQFADMIGIPESTLSSKLRAEGAWKNGEKQKVVNGIKRLRTRHLKNTDCVSEAVDWTQARAHQVPKEIAELFPIPEDKQVSAPNEGQPRFEYPDDLWISERNSDAMGRRMQSAIKILKDEYTRYLRRSSNWCDPKAIAIALSYLTDKPMSELL